jgi:hypothetical protein
MSGATPKSKPPTPGAARRPTASTTATTPGSSNTTASAVNRSPSRAMAPQASPTPSTPTGVNRTRSIRNGAPVSARAAARKPPTDTDGALDDLRAEMQARLDELQEKLNVAEQQHEESQKQASILQLKLAEARKDQAQLEEGVHEQSEKIEELENEKKESLRARRELEQIYEAERAQSMKEREEAQQRIEELENGMQRMKETLAQKELRAGVEDGHGRPSTSRAASFRSEGSAIEVTSHQFAPPGSLQRSDSRSSSKLVMQKDKIIEDLRLELAEAHYKLVETDNVGGGRLQQLQKELYDIKIQNARLMEENDSFQLLLSEKTLNGDFANSELLRPPSISGSRPPSSRTADLQRSGTSLADELEHHDDGDSMLEADSPPPDEQVKKLHSEINSLKDQNKALTLYINNIISRLLQHEQFEQILDKTPDIMGGPKKKAPAAAAANTEKDLPPPPPPKDEKPAEEPQGFLQRAKSVMGRGARRPMSQMVGSSEQEKLAQQLKAEEQTRLTENPETAPRVPLGRSTSVRTGHRRANSEMPGAASIVTNMYRGPSPGLQGPVSPGLVSPTGRGSFFTSAQPLGAAGRVPSGTSSSGTIPTISETEGAKARDSKMASSSHRSSIIYDHPSAADLAMTEGTGSIISEGRGPSSPPRSTTSSGERDRTGGGAIMMGSKPRPLRLVQEAKEEEKERKAANRASWFGGWIAGAAGSGTGGGRSVSGTQ